LQGAEKQIRVKVLRTNHGVANEQIHGEVLSLMLIFHTRGDDKFVQNREALKNSIYN
jgi:hypothetical protein